MNMMAKISRVVYQNIFKPLFFKFDPEFVHDRITSLGELVGKSSLLSRIIYKSFAYENDSLEQILWGISFKNPIGLSAGFDKDGKLFSVMGSVGFGFSEIGTMTYLPYEGNPTPRLYRLPKSKGLVVYYGLKNEGVNRVMGRLSKICSTHPIPGVISIGRTNSMQNVSVENSIDDYFNCLKSCIEARVGEAYEINISCPNIFGGKFFTDPKSLDALLSRLYSLPIQKPVFIKMPINDPWPDFKKIVDVALSYKVDALTIGNLNKNKEDSSVVKDYIPEYVKGAISGKPTEKLSNELIAKTYEYCGDKIKIIGVGGIFNAKDAYEKICRGASLVELITGMVFEGPQLIGEINRDIKKFLERDGYANIAQAVGSRAKI